MTVILQDIVPTIIDILKLAYAAIAVYSLLIQSSFQVRGYEKGEYEYRRDCGGTTTWLHQALAGSPYVGWEKVLYSIYCSIDRKLVFNIINYYSAYGNEQLQYPSFR